MVVDKYKTHQMITRNDKNSKRKRQSHHPSEFDSTSESDSDSDSDSESGQREDSQINNNAIYKQEIENHSALYDYTTSDLFYYCGLPKAQRAQIIAAEDAIIERTNPNGVIPLRFQILHGNASSDVKALAIDKLNSCSDSKTLNWVKGFARLPFGIFKNLEVSSLSPKSEISAFLNHTRAVMDKEVYGHKEAKRYILFTLAKWITNPDAAGIVIGIEGDPGSGKTLLVKQGLSKALNLPCAFVPLGGANSASFLDGHNYCYEGSMYGKIAEVLMEAKCMNPIMCFDELDKVADNSHGQEVFNVLIHLTDATQNNAFHDQYFHGIDLDVSRSIIVFTYNDESKIHPVLKDRMIKIKTSTYTPKDKTVILRQYMLPKIAEVYGFGSIEIDDAAAQKVVSASTSMRDIKHIIDTTISSINFDYVMDKDNNCDRTRLVITSKTLIVPKNNIEREFLPMYM